MSFLFSNLPPETADKHIREAQEEQEIPPNKRLKTESAAPAGAQVKSAPFAGQDPVATALIKITTHISSSKKFPKASELLRQLILEHKIGEEHTTLVFEVVLHMLFPSRSVGVCPVLIIQRVFAHFPHQDLLVCVPCVDHPKGVHKQALKASLRDSSCAEDPQLRREYLKLFTLASKAADVRHAANPLAYFKYPGTYSIHCNRNSVCSPVAVNCFTIQKCTVR